MCVFLVLGYADDDYFCWYIFFVVVYIYNVYIGIDIFKQNKKNDLWSACYLVFIGWLLSLISDNFLFFIWMKKNLINWLVHSKNFDWFFLALRFFKIFISFCFAFFLFLRFFYCQSFRFFFRWRESFNLIHSILSIMLLMIEFVWYFFFALNFLHQHAQATHLFCFLFY